MPLGAVASAAASPRVVCSANRIREKRDPQAGKQAQHAYAHFYGLIEKRKTSKDGEKQRKMAKGMS